VPREIIAEGEGRLKLKRVKKKKDIERKIGSWERGEGIEKYWRGK